MNQEKTSDTPETDKSVRTFQAWDVPSGRHVMVEYVFVHTAKRLERERDEALASLAAAESWSATVADIGDDFRAKLVELRHAVRNLRDVQGRHHTQQATERLFALLPE